VPLVIYAILTEQNIAKLFMAAVIPGIIAMLGYMRDRHHRPHRSQCRAARRDPSFAEKLKALAETWPVMLIFIAVIGGIYGGFFTPTEAASIGTLATAFVAWRSGGLSKRGFLECVYGTSQATAMIFLILLGADIMNVFLALTQMPANWRSGWSGLGLSPMLVLFVIIIIYLILGCIMDSLSMIMLTIPIFFPSSWAWISGASIPKARRSGSASCR
jgi:C4-dicarboxylate transporter DctM subunit